MSDDDFQCVEAHDCPMSTCAAPAGSPCRTGKGKVAVQYHTARFRLVPHLAKTLNVPLDLGRHTVYLDELIHTLTVEWLRERHGVQRVLDRDPAAASVCAAHGLVGLPG